MFKINLTDDDFDKCVQMTHEFQDETMRSRHQTKYGQPISLAFEQTLQGYLGEQAVAHYFNFDLQYTKYDKKKYDILGYEVRTTYWHKGCLLTHPVIERVDKPGTYFDDKPGIYILVTIDKNTLNATIHGWRDIADCNAVKSHWDTTMRWPCFKTPQNELWPIDMLPATLELIAHQAKLAA